MPVSANNYKTTLDKLISLYYNIYKKKRGTEKGTINLFSFFIFCNNHNPFDKSISLCYNNYITSEEQKGKTNSVPHTRKSKGT